MRNMSKKTRKLIDRKVVHKYFWFDYLEGSIFYHSNHVWPARLWIGDAIDHNDDTQCWMYVPAHKEYVQAILIVKRVCHFLLKFPNGLTVAEKNLDAKRRTS